MSDSPTAAQKQFAAVTIVSGAIFGLMALGREDSAPDSSQIVRVPVREEALVDGEWIEADRTRRFVELAIGLVDPPTDPVDPPTDPVDPPTDPVDPPTDPVDPPEQGERDPLRWEDLRYVGAFVPRGISGADRFGYIALGLAFDPGGDPGGGDDGHPGALILSCHAYSGKVARISIPKPMIGKPDSWEVSKAFVSGAPRGEILGSPFDPTDGLSSKDTLGTRNNLSLSGMLVFDGAIWWTVFSYYNVTCTDFLSHGRSALSGSPGIGLFGLSEHQMRTSGPLVQIPAWFGDRYLGGARIASGYNTAQGIACTSHGPALYAFDHRSRIESGARLESTPIIHHALDNPWQGNDHKLPDWTPFHLMQGAAWVDDGERSSVVFFSPKAVGGVDSIHYTTGGLGAGSRGYHSRRGYSAEALVYPSSELERIARDEIQPWEATPQARVDLREEGVWWPTMFVEGSTTTDAGEVIEYSGFAMSQVAGAAWDEESGYLYACQSTGWNSGEPSPVIHCWSVRD